MTNNASEMSGFSFAPHEQDLVEEHFSPNILLYWLKTTLVVSNMRVQPHLKGGQ